MTRLGRELIEGMKNAVAYAQGEPAAGTRTTVVEVPDIDVRRVRKALHLTQKSFAETFGFSLSALRNWEQGTRRPERAAKILLAVIERHPETVQETLAALAAEPRPAAATARS